MLLLISLKLLDFSNFSNFSNFSVFSTFSFLLVSAFSSAFEIRIVHSKIVGYIIDEPEPNDKELVCKFLYYALLPKPKKVRITTPPELKEKKEKTTTSKPKAPKHNKPKASSFSSLGKLSF